MGQWDSYMRAYRQLVGFVLCSWTCPWFPMSEFVKSEMLTEACCKREKGSMRAGTQTIYYYSSPAQACGAAPNIMCNHNGMCWRLDQWPRASEKLTKFTMFDSERSPFLQKVTGADRFTQQAYISLYPQPDMIVKSTGHRWLAAVWKGSMVFHVGWGCKIVLFCVGW